MTQDAGERAVPTLPRLEPVHQLSGLAWLCLGGPTVNVRLLNVSTAQSTTTILRETMSKKNGQSY